MSFSGFEQPKSLAEYKAILEKVSSLSSDFKGAIDERAGIEASQKKQYADEAAPIVDALKKKGDNAQLSLPEQNEIVNILQTKSMEQILEYFTNQRPDLVPKNPKLELDLQVHPNEIAGSPVSYNFKKTPMEMEVNTPTQGVVLFKITRPMLWALLLDYKSLKKMGLMASLSAKDVAEYIDLIDRASDGKYSGADKLNKIKAVRTVPGISSWSDYPTLAAMDVQGFSNFMEGQLLYRGESTLVSEMLTKGFEPTNTAKYHTGLNVFYIATPQVIGILSFRGNDVTVQEVDPSTGAATGGTSTTTFVEPQTKFMLFFSYRIYRNVEKELAGYSERNTYDTQYKWDLYPRALAEYGNFLVNSIRYGRARLGANRPPKDQDVAALVTGFGVKPRAKPGRKPAPKVSPYAKQNPKSAGRPSKPEAYLISGGRFGSDIDVDVPRLYNKLRLRATKGGQIIVDEPADQSTIDILTRRTNPRKMYTDLAVKNLSKLMKHTSDVSPTSKKLKIAQNYFETKRVKKEGRGQVSDDDDPDMDRLILLISEAKAGNYPNEELQDEISQLADRLFIQGKLPKAMHRDIMGGFVFMS